MHPFFDINYAIASKEDKTAMFLNYSELLNALDTGSTTKITINNKRLNRQNFEETILLPPRGDFLDGYRAEYNAMLTDNVTDSSNSVCRSGTSPYPPHKKNDDEARTLPVSSATSPAGSISWTPTARNWTPSSVCGSSTRC